MKRDNSLAANPRCHLKLVWDRQTLAVMSGVMEDSLLFPRVTNDKEEGVCTSCAPSHTRDPLHHTCKGAQRRSETQQTMMATRVASLTPMQSHDPQNLCDPFTCQMHAFTKHINQSKTNSNKSASMSRHAACLHSNLPYLHPASPAHLTLHFESVSAPAASSCSTTAACPLPAALASGVSPSCGARQRSGRHPSLAAQVRAPPPTPASLCITKPRKGKNEMERNNSLAANPQCLDKLVWDGQTSR